MLPFALSHHQRQLLTKTCLRVPDMLADRFICRARRVSAASRLVSRAKNAGAGSMARGVL